MSKKTLLLLVFALLIFLQCERFTGYDLDSEPTQESATIYGQITDTFSKRPVFKANVTLENLRTLTDSHGEYLFLYTLQDDEIRNKPVKITITAENYLPFTDEFLLFPVREEKNYTLDYAAPIIRRNVFVFYDPFMICQVLMVDYQGISTLNPVIATFDYVKPETHEHRYLVVEMDFIQALSDTTAYYQAIAPLTLPGDWLLDLKNNYQVDASDNSGYSVSQSRQYSSGQFADTLLFEPVLP
jgi:hypothetical protein